MSREAQLYLNGGFIAAGQARVSVMDRGFLFGDGVYEVIPRYQGKFFLLDPHLQRLDRSLAGIRLQNPLPHDRWGETLEELVRVNAASDCFVYLQVTRGPAPTREHLFPAVPEPTVLAMILAAKTPGRDTVAAGVPAVTLPDQRWSRCDIKAVTLLQNVLARQSAQECNAVEAIMLRDGRVTEGTSTNVFVVTNGEAATPPLGPEILPGITRAFVIGLMKDANISAVERPVTESELRAADEIWISSSTREVLAVTRLDDDEVGSGVPGPVFQRVYSLFQEAKAR